MKIKQIRLHNINSYSETNFIELSDKINIFVGANNAGKSTILNSILILQHQELANISLAINKSIGAIMIAFEHTPYEFDITLDPRSSLAIVTTIDKNVLKKTLNRFIKQDNSIDTTAISGFTEFNKTEPKNIIYPFLSKRKVTKYNESINGKTSKIVSGTLEFLFAKIDNLSNRANEGHNLYWETCEKIFGFPITVVDTDAGKKAAYKISETEHVPVTSMGDGTINILGLLVQLCVAKNKIFIIEELENDVHPKALKAILELIKLKSEENQFFISTHSNIVLRQLGGEETNIFKIDMRIDETTRIPVSEISTVGDDISERIKLLEDLGYEFTDYNLTGGWLFLEEASAERIIREYFIKWYTPKLLPILKTFSAKSKDEISTKFENFKNLFTYLHKEPVYKNKAWVIIDAGDSESKIIEDLQSMYSKHGWNKKQFSQFNEHDFEKYYPERFRNEVDQVLSLQHKAKWEAKKRLFDTVIEWIQNDEPTAKNEFKKSAEEVIDKLKEIEATLTN